MTRTTIRIGHVAIDGMSRVPAPHAFGRHVESAIADALSRPFTNGRGAGDAAMSLPVLRVKLRSGAGEAEVARAVGNAVRDALARAR